MIGSVYNAVSANSSSVVMAYWPGRGDDLSSIDYAHMRVGTAQYFFKHHAVICSPEDASLKQDIDLIFACVYWKQKHPNQEWFGNSATVCFNMFELF